MGIEAPTVEKFVVSSVLLVVANEALLVEAAFGVAKCREVDRISVETPESGLVSAIEDSLVGGFVEISEIAVCTASE